MGHDSNPDLSADAKGSWFSVYNGGIGKRFLLSDQLVLGTFMDGRYQDYWQTEDNYQARAGGSLSYALMEGRFTPAFLLEGALKRNHLVTAEDRNELMAGLAADIIMGTRVNLRFENTWSRQNYLNWAQPFSGRGQGRGTQGKGATVNTGAFFRNRDFLEGPTGGRGGGGQYGCGRKSILYTYLPPRKNLLVNTSLAMDLFLTASLSASLYGGFAVLNASEDLESYRNLETGISLLWQPFDKWQIMGEAQWSQMNYHKVPDCMRQCVRDMNDIYAMGFQVSRFWGAFEIFLTAGFTRGEAPLDYVTYRQTVIQCGLAWSL